jgi:acyl-CoA synthetase (AMP-forming)/AMP-acid ligase II
MHPAYFLERNSVIYRNKIAVACNGSTLSYGELRTRASTLAQSLIFLPGISKGDRIAFLDHNSNEYVEFHLAIPLAGLIAVPLNFRLAPQELRAIINGAECRALIYRSSFAPVVDRIRGELPSVEHFISLDGARATEPGYEEILSISPPGEVGEPLEDDPACILFTSGTTGIPKGATLTHRNMMSAMRGNVIELGILPENKFLHVAPLFHIAPLQILLAHLYRGCTCVLAPQFEPEAAIDLIRRERISNTFLVPRMVSAIFDNPRASANDLASLRTVAYGGAPTPAAVLQRLIDKWGPIFVQVYGASEAGLITVLPACDHLIEDEHSRRKFLGSCGRQIIDVRIKLVNESGKAAPAGEVGEILVRGEGVMQGYWQLPDETRQSINDGWFHTGDLGRMDKDGYLFHVDRKRYMIISGGENIYPAEVEQVIHLMPEVQEVAVIGLSDEKWGETVKAIVVLKEGQVLTESEIIEFCKKHLASYKKPTSVDFIGELPRNAAGKILKGILKERYETGTAFSAQEE